MATERFNFPKNFLWGTATAAHQVEGNNLNCDYWVVEHTPGSPFFEPSGDACDQYHRYPEDIAMLARLGFNSYRFSIEWARVEPEPGEFSIAALDHYRRVLACCHEHKITPIVTFHISRRRDGSQATADGRTRKPPSDSQATANVRPAILAT
jgi:beta-glucosidase